MSKPISPAEAQIAHKKYIFDKASAIPEVIIEAVNTLIVKNMNATATRSEVSTEEIVDLVTTKDRNMTLGKIYKEKWLDIEPLYENTSWKIHYDQSENDGAYFVFSKKE